MSETRWLDAEEMAIWRDWLVTSTRIAEALDRDLQEPFGRSMAEYEVLVQLSAAEGRRMRMAELAHNSLQSRSRLTHTIDRLQAAGIVERQPCDDDRRGTWAILTDEGYAHLVEMAPVHVASVRRHLIDVVNGADPAGFGSTLAALRASVDAAEEG